MQVDDTTGNGAPNLQRVSCATSPPKLRVALDGYSDSAFTYDGNTWSPRIPFAHTVNDVSCPSSTFCMVVGYQYGYTYKDGTWSSPTPIPGITFETNAVSCLASDTCVAVGQAAKDFAVNSASYNAAIWSGPTQIPTPSAAEIFNSVSCANLTFCVAVGQSGLAYSYNGTRVVQHVALVRRSARR